MSRQLTAIFVSGLLNNFGFWIAVIWNKMPFNHFLKIGANWSIGLHSVSTFGRQWYLQKYSTRKIIITALFMYTELRDMKRQWAFTPNAQHACIQYSLLISSSITACGVKRGSYRSTHNHFVTTHHTTTQQNTPQQFIHSCNTPFACEGWRIMVS